MSRRKASQPTRTFQALKRCGYPISDIVAEILDEKHPADKMQQLDEAAQWLRDNKGIHCTTEMAGDEWAWIVQGDLPDYDDGLTFATHYQALEHALFIATKLS